MLRFGSHEIPGISCILSNLSFCSEIHVAVQSGDLDKVKTLIKTNPDLVFTNDQYGNTPLFFAKTKEMAEFLLKNKAKVDARNNSKGTPMENAADYGYYDVAEFLIANGAKVEARDMFGTTPLMGAAMNGRKDVVKLLLSNKADINGKDDEGKTPLHIAALDGFKETVELLLRNQWGRRECKDNRR